MNGEYRIGTFALVGGISARTLRFYDQIGLLRPARIDPRTRYRLYLPRQLRELAAIIELKDAGVPLAEIRRLKGRVGLDERRRQVLEGLRVTTGHALARAVQSLKVIDYLLDQGGGDGYPIPVVVKRRPSTQIVSIRSRARSYEAIGRLERELLDSLPQSAVGGIRGTLWHRCAHSGCIDGEPFITLKRRVASALAYKVRQLPSATLACAYSATDDESALRAYRALGTWMRTTGYRLSGPAREIAHDHLLEIQFPIEPLSR
ncbi:MAG TPA: MerR family transcriptional regulator [Steroidobacteraceae bacterium]|nr:MerR family transcriptional regulator [Steroidobacteraceae bacterium]